MCVLALDSREGEGERRGEGCRVDWASSGSGDEKQQKGAVLSKNGGCYHQIPSSLLSDQTCSEMTRDAVWTTPIMDLRTGLAKLLWRSHLKTCQTPDRMSSLPNPPPNCCLALGCLGKQIWELSGRITTSKITAWSSTWHSILRCSIC